MKFSQERVSEFCILLTKLLFWFGSEALLVMAFRHHDAQEDYGDVSPLLLLDHEEGELEEEELLLFMLHSARK